MSAAMNKPRALDLFCGQGGTTQGLIDAGFDVTGVDLADHSKRYPGTFVRGNALDYIEAHGREFDVIFAGPPCQSYSIATAGNPAARAKYDRLIAVTRDLLEQTGRPWVIENVEQARSEMRDPILLCGRMFGLHAYDTDSVRLVLDRHRLFESNVPLTAPEHPEHHEYSDEFVAGVYGGARRAPTMLRITSPDGLMDATRRTLPAKWKREGIPAGWTVEKITPTPADDRFAARIERGGGYVPRSIRAQQRLLGVDWMTVRGMQESIPPAYSQWIGAQLLAHIGSEVAA